MYDAQEKQRRDLLWLQNIAIEEAEERGKLQGELLGEARGELRGELKGKVRTLQEILGLPSSTDSELKKRTLEELQAQMADLQIRVKTRG